MNTAAGHICVWSEEAALFSAVAYYRIDAQAKLPEPQTNTARQDGAADFRCAQLFPATAPTAEIPEPPASKDDRSFTLHGIVQGEWEWDTDRQRCLSHSRSAQPLRLDIALYTPRDHAEPAGEAGRVIHALSRRPAREILDESAAFWKDYWSRSAVAFDDSELERLWYHNQYFLGCCLRQGSWRPACSVTGPAAGSAPPGTATTT